MRRYFRAVSGEDCGSTGLPMGFSSGYSAIDGLDWCIETYMLKADEVPQECTDAKTFAQFMAGLLNAYYNGINVSEFDADRVIWLGDIGRDIPHPSNPVLPFPE